MGSRRLIRFHRPPFPFQQVTLFVGLVVVNHHSNPHPRLMHREWEEHRRPSEMGLAQDRLILRPAPRYRSPAEGETQDRPPLHRQKRAAGYVLLHGTQQVRLRSMGTQQRPSNNTYHFQEM